jgi:hypothetical protein
MHARAPDPRVRFAGLRLSFAGPCSGAASSPCVRLCKGSNRCEPGPLIAHLAWLCNRRYCPRISRVCSALLAWAATARTHASLSSSPRGPFQKPSQHPALCRSSLLQLEVRVLRQAREAAAHAMQWTAEI